ncbi:MAG TPA: S41 family peptidase [Bryobacteraceae bacterium]|nr:S41 family peptidase [Bryobacteraceae bacterium]
MAFPNPWMRRLHVPAAALCLTAFCAMAQPAGFNRAPWLEDYAALKHALEKRYSNLAWFGSPEGGVDLPALDRRTMAALEAAANDEDARAALRGFVTAFHDGHFSQLASPAPSLPAKPPRVPDPVYSSQNAVDGCAAQGYAVGDDTQFSTPFESLPGFHLLADGLSQAFRAGTLTDGSDRPRLGIVRIPVFEATHPSLCLQAWTHTEVWGADGKFKRGALRGAVEQLWYQSLAEILRKFKADGVAAVIVDIGNNSGGDDSGDIAARLFTGHPVHSSPLWMAQDPAASTAYFDEVLNDLHGVLESAGSSKKLVEESIAAFAAGKENLSQEVCPVDWVWHERRQWSSQSCRRLVRAGSAGGPLDVLAPGTVADSSVAQTLHWPARIEPLWGSWTGPVYVLTDGRTYSAAEMFAAVMQNNGIAKIVGVKTGGDGCGFMHNPGPLVLPNSQMRFRIPNCVRIKADGTDEVAGVVPDIPILPAEGENAKQRAVRLVSELYAGLGRKN